MCIARPGGQIHRPIKLFKMIIIDHSKTSRELFLITALEKFKKKCIPPLKVGNITLKLKSLPPTDSFNI